MSVESIQGITQAIIVPSTTATNPPGNPKGNRTRDEIGDQNNRQAQHGHQRTLENLQRELHGDKPDGDAGESGKQSRPRRATANPRRHERAQKLDNPTPQTSQQPHLPRMIGGGLFD